MFLCIHSLRLGKVRKCSFLDFTVLKNERNNGGHLFEYSVVLDGDESPGSPGSLRL